MALQIEFWERPKNWNPKNIYDYDMIKEHRIKSIAEIYHRINERPMNTSLITVVHTGKKKHEQIVWSKENGIEHKPKNKVIPCIHCKGTGKQLV